MSPRAPHYVGAYVLTIDTTTTEPFDTWEAASTAADRYIARGCAVTLWAGGEFAWSWEPGAPPKDPYTEEGRTMI